MQLTSTQTENETIVVVDSATLDASVSPQFKSGMMKIIDDGATQIVLDMAAVRVVDSSGLGAMVSILKAMGTEGTFVIRNGAPAVIGLLRLTRMDRVFKIEESTQCD